MSSIAFLCLLLTEPWRLRTMGRPSVPPSLRRRHLYRCWQGTLGNRQCASCRLLGLAVTPPASAGRLEDAGCTAVYCCHSGPLHATPMG